MVPVARIVAACFVAVLVCAQGNAAPAEVVVLDFENLAHDDALIVDYPQPYLRGGFVLTPAHHEPGNPERFGVIGTVSNLFAGSTTLYHGVSNGVITLTAKDGGPFDILSIDLAELPPGSKETGGPFNSGPFGVTFTGKKFNGSHVNATATVDSFLTLSTFTFTDDFRDVASVAWRQGTGFNPSHQAGEPTHQFDNVAVRLALPVPEPSTLMIA